MVSSLLPLRLVLSGFILCVVVLSRTGINSYTCLCLPNFGTTLCDPRWTRFTGTPSTDIATDIAVLPSTGEIYLAGRVAAGTIGGLTVNGTYDGVIEKRAPNGTVLWTRLTGGPQVEAFGSVAIFASTGTVFAAGSTNGYAAGANVIDTQNAIGASDMLVVRYSAAGLRVWSRVLGGIQTDTL
jgi:hypothetical protein